MKFQSDKHSCGVFAVLNACYCIGKHATEKFVRSFTETTELGTDEFGIMRALVALEVKHEIVDSSSYNESFCALEESLSESHSIILCVDNYNHWVVCAGKFGNKFILFDSLNTKKNMKKSGFVLMSRKQLSKFWKSKEGKFYGIICKKK